MSIALTPLGQEAYDLLGWVYGDIPGRVANARQEIAGLWDRAAPGDEKNQVGDVASILSKLDDAGASMSPITISSQVLRENET
jgi:hypothetical protein